MTEAARRLFEERLRENGGAAERALAEVVQYVTLLGLSRTNFFAVAALDRIMGRTSDGSERIHVPSVRTKVVIPA